MITRKILERWVIGSAFLGVFFAVCLVSISGLVPPSDIPSRSVGSMVVSTVENGIAFSEPGQKYFFTISPFNDYAVRYDGFTEALISKEEADWNRYSASLPLSKLGQIHQTILNYTDQITPSITFYTEKKINYTTEINGNSVILTRTVSWPERVSIDRVGMVASFSSGDMIFDEYGNVYTYQSAQALDGMSHFFNTPFYTPFEDLQNDVPANRIYVLNPQMASVLMITLSANQTARIDRNKNFIEIEENVSGLPISQYSQSISITIIPITNMTRI